MAGEAQVPGREMGQAEFRHICHRYHVAGQLVAGRAVLEVGCGAGIGLPYLASLAERVVGTDLFEDNIRIAASHVGPRLAVAVMDAHDLKYPDASFDVILAMEVLQYLRIHDFLSEARRLLKPGGKLFLCLPNPDRPGFVPGRNTLAYHSVGGLRRALEQAGFTGTIHGVFLHEPARKAVDGVMNRVLAGGSRTLDLLRPILPVRRIKDALRRLLRYKPIRLQSALDAANMAAIDGVPFEELGSAEQDLRHIFLYATVSPGQPS